MDRRSTSSSYLARHSSHSSNPNVFSDEYALQAIESDGKRQRSSVVDDGDPAGSSDNGPEESQRSTSRLQRQRPHIGSMVKESHSYQITRQNSHSSRLSHSRSMASVSDAPSSSTARRSTRTSFGYPRAQSPYQGATGPSHPYAMYSQDTNLTRTPSVATTSTMRQPERPYTGPRGPTQPYGMYTQNTVSEDHQNPFNDSNHVTEPAYPAGSRPAPQAHQRRLGPDGEDIDDLIGPDGYTEQLPPYTRYPNDIPPKRDLDAPRFVDAPSPIPRPVHPISNSINQSSIANSTPYSSDGSQETLHNRRQSGDTPIFVSHTLVQTSSQNPFEDSSTQVSSTTAVDVLPKALPKDEGGTFTRRAQSRGKRRVCWGLLPCWLLTVIILIGLAIVIGGIVGGALAHRQGVQKGIQAASSMSPLPSPYGPLATLRQELLTMPSISITSTVSISPGQTPDDATPLPTPTNMPTIPTGSFAVTLNDPTVITSACLTEPVQNNSWDCSNGATLNIVINLTPQSSSPYVSLTYPPLPNGQIRYGAQPPQLSGPTNLVLSKDKSAFNNGPAYAFEQFFNKTVIVRAEDFPGAIPLSKRDRGWSMKRWFQDSAVWEGLSMLSKRQEQESDWNQTEYASPTDRPWLCFWNQTILDGFIYVTENVNAAASAAPSAGALAPASSSPRKRQVPLNLAPYPKAIKIEERRNGHNTILPYCQQMQVLQNGQLGTVAKDDGTLNIVNIAESEGSITNMNQMQQSVGNYGYGSSAAASASGPSSPQALNLKRVIREYNNRCECSWANN